MRDFTIQVGGKTYTRDNIHELEQDQPGTKVPNGPSVHRSGGTVNVAHDNANVAIQAGEIHGDITFD